MFLDSDLPGLVYHPDYAVGISRSGVTRLTKYAALHGWCFEILGIRPTDFVRPRPVSFETLSLTHDPEYVRSIQSLNLSDGALRRIGFSRVPEIYTRPALSTGGTLEAAKRALATGRPWFNLAGGSHHAHKDFGSGYCVFNDVAVAAKVLLQDGTARRIAVLDLDVHQGDGTAALFALDQNVKTVSVHGDRNFPLRKAVSDLDIALPEGTKDKDYLRAVEKALDYLSATGPFDLLFYNAGVDVMADDRLGKFSLSAEGLAAREEQVFGFARKNNLPIVTVLGGGYQEDKAKLACLHGVAIKAAKNCFRI